MRQPSAIRCPANTFDECKRTLAGFALRSEFVGKSGRIGRSLGGGFQAGFP
jgi:hypothetical protein